jgi:hypothetical protein
MAFALRKLMDYVYFDLLKASNHAWKILLTINETNSLTDEERQELEGLDELDRFFTYLNARLLASK